MIKRISYKDFISKHLDITEAEVFAVLQDLASDSGLGIDACPAGAAINYGGWLRFRNVFEEFPVDN